MATANRIRVRVRRFNPESGRSWVQEYEVPLRKGMTVLDALIYIKTRLDPTLTFRYSCRMGVCGSCGLLVNDTPRLACQTQVSEVVGEGGLVELAPLPGYPVLRDLVVDMSRMFRNHRLVKPYIVRRDMREVEEAPREFIVAPRQHLETYQYSLCIMCGLCNAACPVFNSNPNYLGPQALTVAYRFVKDPRDEAVEERIAMVSSPDGCLACHFAASCSAVCPKAVDPASAIQRLRRIIARAALGGYRKKTSRIAPPLEKPLRNIEQKPPTHNLAEGVSLEELEKEPPPPILDPESL